MDRLKSNVIIEGGYSKLKLQDLLIIKVIIMP